MELNNIQCTGCGACYNICPTNAIKMVQNNKGFYIPFINSKKCIDCKRCIKVCPLLNPQNTNNIKKVIGLINKNTELRLKASSGAAFSLFASQIIKNGGIVFGVIWDNDMRAVHGLATNMSELECMYGSKYVQSNTMKSYKTVKKYLETGRLVLFSGTPCQIAGLNSYLNKNYKNLILVDLVCHGVPSPSIFEKYKKEFMVKHKDNGKIINIMFRSKRKGWSKNYIVKTITSSREYYEYVDDNDFLLSYLRMLNINDACLSCQFNSLERSSDITLADFWGGGAMGLDDKKGTSLILLNSQKGEDLFNLIKDNCIYREVPIEFALKNNYSINHPAIAHPKRDEFFNDILQNTLGLDKINSKYIKFKKYPNYIVKLVRKQPIFIKNLIKKVTGL